VNTTKDTKSAKESEDEALDAVFEFGVVETDQQSNLHARKSYAGQQPGLVNSFHLLDTLEFEDSLVLDQ